MNEFINPTVNAGVERQKNGGAARNPDPGILCVSPSTRAGLSPNPTSAGRTPAKIHHATQATKAGEVHTVWAKLQGLLAVGVLYHPTRLAFAWPGPTWGKIYLEDPSMSPPTSTTSPGSPLSHQPIASGARPAAAHEPSAWSEPLTQGLEQPCSTVIKDQTWDPEEGK